MSSFHQRRDLKDLILLKAFSLTYWLYKYNSSIQLCCVQLLVFHFQAAIVNIYERLCTIAFVPEWHHCHMLIFFNTDLWHGSGDVWNWVVNKQAQGHFRLDVTFKVLFILYIQYTSQKYTVNLQRRASRYTIKSASGDRIFRWRLQSEKHISSSSPCFYIVQMSEYKQLSNWR